MGRNAHEIPPLPMELWLTIKGSCRSTDHSQWHSSMVPFFFFYCRLPMGLQMKQSQCYHHFSFCSKYSWADQEENKSICLGFPRCFFHLRIYVLGRFESSVKIEVWYVCVCMLMYAHTCMHIYVHKTKMNLTVCAGLRVYLTSRFFRFDIVTQVS